LQNGKWYFIAGVIEPNNKKFTYVVGDRSSGTVWKSEVLTIGGELNRSCTADLVIGMHADTYYYAGGFDEWFLDCDSPLTADDLVDYFNATILCNGADSSSDVDAMTDASGVTLRQPTAFIQKAVCFIPRRQSAIFLYRQGFLYKRIHRRHNGNRLGGNFHQ
jgi:hypothetical protein